MFRRKQRRKKVLFIAGSIICAGSILFGTAQMVMAYHPLLSESAYSLYETVFESWMGGAMYVREGQSDQDENLVSVLASSVMGSASAENYVKDDQTYETNTESESTYKTILANEANDENHIADDGTLVQSSASVESEATPTETEPTTTTDILMDKLNDFDYLVQNFYVIDSTTTIDSSKLNAQTMLSDDMTVDFSGDDPKILIYHTHSLEAFADSNGTDASQTVVGLGNTLTEILEEQYGMSVYHDTTAYDAEGRDQAYSRAEPSIEQILAEYPSIEVVIDLHRDGVAEGTHLVTEQNGTQMASIMFFNGLSYLTSTGDISYLPNPYIEDNLAFSFQMQLTAAEYYPGFSRCIYLKGYRYNMQFKPKSLLVEVGAQTNTLEEAYNAMPVLADLLHKVLSGEDP